MKHVSGKRLAEIALSRGWVFVSQSGSHAKYRNPVDAQRVIIPIHGNRDLCPTTQKGIMRILGLTDADL